MRLSVMIPVKEMIMENFFSLFDAGRSIDKLESSFPELKVTIRSY